MPTPFPRPTRGLQSPYLLPRSLESLDGPPQLSQASTIPLPDTLSLLQTPLVLFLPLWMPQSSLQPTNWFQFFFLPSEFLRVWTTPQYFLLLPRHPQISLRSPLELSQSTLNTLGSFLASVDAPHFLPPCSLAPSYPLKTPPGPQDPLHPPSPCPSLYLLVLLLVPPGLS